MQNINFDKFENLLVAVECIVCSLNWESLCELPYFWPVLPNLLYLQDKEIFSFD